MPELLPYSIRLARLRDLDEILALLATLSQWLADLGSDQWQGLEGRRRDQIRTDILDESVWVVEDAGTIIATITVDPLADADFWCESDDVHCALYAHRMGVARSHRGQLIGAALLDWASGLVESRGLRLLRFDAWRTNEQLHHYYKELGFDMVGSKHVDGRGSGALFEREASERCGGPQFATPLPGGAGSARTEP